VLTCVLCLGDSVAIIGIVTEVVILIVIVIIIVGIIAAEFRTCIHEVTATSFCILLFVTDYTVAIAVGVSVPCFTLIVIAVLFYCYKIKTNREANRQFW